MSAAESIGTSLQAAARLGPDAKSQLVHAATEAYYSSMRLTYTVAAAIVGVAIVVAYRFLPARAATTAEETDLVHGSSLEGLRLGIDHVAD